MRGERRLLRAGEYLVGWAARRLPAGIRDERHQEWAAELPAILHDPDTRSALWRAVRMLGYAADTFRGAGPPPGKIWRRLTWDHIMVGLYVPLGITGLWIVTDTPGNWANYLFLMPFALLIALPRPTMRKASTYLYFYAAAQIIGRLPKDPGDWVSYVLLAPLPYFILTGIYVLVYRRHGRHSRPFRW